MQLTNLMLVEFVLKALAKGTRYWYGTFGLKATTSLYNSKKGQYPSHYTSARAAQYKADIAAAKWVADCVGLIKWFFWSQGGTRDTKYADGFPDVSADQFIASCCEKTGAISSLPEIPGLVLWCKGHIGVYIGGGWAIEARGFAYGVVKTKVKDRTWTKWGKIKSKYITYTDGAIDTGTGGDPVDESTLGSRILRYRTGVSLMNGPDVRQMQEGLIALGFGKYLGTDGADGWFGRMTDTAVRAFQKAYVLEIDGEFGPKSLAMMTSLLNAAQWHEPDNTDPLTEDDLPPPVIDEQSGEEIDEPDAPDNDEEPEPDAPMGAGMVNPYPLPANIKKVGSKGQAVKWIQWELLQSGYWAVKVNGKTENMEIDGDFGPITDAAVRAFQKAHTDASGKKLTVDGEVGPKTIAALIDETGTCTHLTTTPTAPAATDKRGMIIDVSHHNGTDWNTAVKNHQIDLAIIRIQDNTTADRNAKTNVKAVTKYAIPYGFYAYIRAKSEAAAIKEADLFVDRALEACKGQAQPRFWMVDAEVGNSADATYAFGKRVKARLEALGLDPIVGLYASDSDMINRYKNIAKKFHRVWTADWRKACKKWSDLWCKITHLWQYGYVTVKGLGSTVDGNRLPDGVTVEQFLTK